jgi:formate dehydrogenase major subunit
MTNHWIDFKNSDCILVMGSNPAENHPVSFKWIMEAIEKGATLLCVDPRFTRTAAKSHLYAPLRSGTDIALLGGMIKYILDNNLYFEEYVRDYTNASFLVNPDFKLPNDNEGVFSGLTGTKTTEGYVSGKYDKTTWSFQKNPDGTTKKDMTMQDPHCVFQLLKKHFSRYTIEKVVAITGTPKEKLLEVYKAYTITGRPDKAGTVLYAMGWTQHTVGVQNIRAMSIIQMLLGNMGMAGGGINALRGESNVQGSTDHGLLFHILPGYLKVPTASQTTLQAYNEANTPKTDDPKSANWWGNFPKYSASLLRSFYGMNATLDEAYGYMPKIDDGANYSWLPIFDRMYKGQFTGFFAWGQNPACSGANANKVRKALAKLTWLVNVNLFDNETGSFWQGPGMNPEEIETEVFLLPCAVSMEKEGSITNSGRWMQWRYKATDPPGEAMPDGEIITELFYLVRELYEKEGGTFTDPIFKLTWDYGFKLPTGRIKQCNPHAVAKEINGYFLQDVEIEGKLYKKGTLVPAFKFLQSDGSTSSGCWIYCNSYTEEGNKAARRGTADPSGIGLYPEWAWCWPVNRRIIYNRASVDLKGKPWAPEKAILWWNPVAAAWEGDVPDGPWPPLAIEGGKYPFIMKPDGLGSIFGPGLADGPFPEHYEPLECPIEKNLISPQFVNPIIKRWEKDGVPELDLRATCDPRFPIVCTTYRVSEHWQTGVMTRWTPWLLELQPEMFVEMGKEIAELKEIKNGDRVIVKSARGEVNAVAIVTARFKPFTIADQIVHEVGIPWHYGWRYPNPELKELRSANLLTPSIGDPNTMIPESKAFMVDVIRKEG